MRLVYHIYINDIRDRTYIHVLRIYEYIYGTYGWVCCVKGKFVCFVRENSLWFYRYYLPPVILYERILLKSKRIIALLLSKFKK